MGGDLIQADLLLGIFDKWDKLDKLQKTINRLSYEHDSLKSGRTKIKIPDLAIKEREVLGRSQIFFTTLMTGGSMKLRNYL